MAKSRDVSVDVSTIVEAYAHLKETGEIVAPKKYPKRKKKDD